ncbi:Na-translocating system protein MpsC family protein [Alteribacillus sp. HJP-4]|uniref:Na-translocating system protein MpsC family protein n=1 Tax=Alteribacillus sp. HJP-4 TaxID=2775394 RepID=UPI0035CD2193
MVEKDFIDDNVMKQQKQIASYTSRTLRDHFGRGPESVYVTLAPSHILIHIRNFLSPIEEVLLEEEGNEALASLRKSIMGPVLAKLELCLQEKLDTEGFSFYVDWNFDQKSGLIVGLNWESLFLKTADQPIYSLLEKDIQKLWEYPPADPEDVFIKRVNSRITLAGRAGYQGNEKNNIASQDITKNYFSKIMGAAVQDIFNIWNEEGTKNIIVFMTSPYH